MSTLKQTKWWNAKLKKQSIKKISKKLEQPRLTWLTHDPRYEIGIIPKKKK
jgi:hypothetical protein